jgi:phosphoribosyl 1,2-cyclic phosphodiesterase
MNMEIQFWGVRGTLPVPGKKTIRYGGNTNCVTLRLGKKIFFIFDAGTGIKALSNYLIQNQELPISAKIFITHPHYDHINGIPFFSPLYLKGNKFEILGPDHSDIRFEQLISKQMNRIYFPVTVKEFGATIKYHSIEERTFYRDRLRIQTIPLNHPGNSLGYRVQYKNKSFCYITDNELYLRNSPYYHQSDIDRLIHFIHKTDVLVIDSTYTDSEYREKTGWGHSCVSRAVDIADKAKVKTVCLYHHDPDQTDKDIDNKLKQAKALLKSRQSKTRCIAPREGSKLII